MRSAGNPCPLQFASKSSRVPVARERLTIRTPRLAQIFHAFDVARIAGLEQDALVPFAEIHHHGHGLELPLQEIEIIITAVFLKE